MEEIHNHYFLNDIRNLERGKPKRGKTGATGATGLSGGPTGATGVSGGITLTITASGGKYIINGATAPVLSFIRGHRYVININANGHGFYFQTSGSAYNSGLVYSTGVTGGGTQVGTIIFEVPYNAPSNLTYVCINHTNMGNTIIVSNLGPKGDTGVGITPINIPRANTSGTNYVLMWNSLTSEIYASSIN